MEQSIVNTTSLKKNIRSRSSFLSRIFHSNSATPTEKKDSNKLEVKERELMSISYSTPTETASVSYNNRSQSDTNTLSADIEIPNRRQSHLYTPFHSNNEHITPAIDNDDIYKRKSYYSSNLTPIDVNLSSSSLTRSATWQPSSSTSPNTQTVNVNIIPDRRTSRNYANNPEIQARLDAMLNSDKASYLTSVLNNGNSLSSSGVNRRSTTPASRNI